MKKVRYAVVGLAVVFFAFAAINCGSDGPSKSEKALSTQVADLQTKLTSQQGQSASPTSAPTTAGATSTPQATPTPTSKPSGAVLGTGETVNIQIINKDGSVVLANGKTYSKFDDFCKIFAERMGGPAYKWVATMQPDGKTIPNSCVFREVDDRDPSAYPMKLLDGIVYHIWLDKNGDKRDVTAVGPGEISGQYGVSRLTLYIAPTVTFGHKGEWTFSDLPGEANGANYKWAKIGTDQPQPDWVLSK